MKKMMRVLAVIVIAAVIAVNGCSAFAELSAEDLQRLDTYYTLATNYIAKAEYEKASEYVNKCFEYCGEDTSADLMADLYLKRGCIATINGDNEAALADLAKATEQKADLADAYLVMTQIYTDMLEIAPAIESLEKYIALTGEDSLYVTMAELCEINGDSAKAAESYEKYVASLGLEDSAAVYANAVYKMELGMSDEAIALFKQCTEDKDYGKASKYNIAVCTMNKGEYEEATKLFNEGINNYGWAWEYEGTYYNLALCSMMQEDYEDAIRNFEKSIERSEFVDDANLNIGICKMTTEDYDGSIEAFSAVTEEAEAETLCAARLYRAYCYEAAGNTEAALADFTYCIDNGYDLAQSYYQRSLIYGEMGETELQCADLEASLLY